MPSSLKIGAVSGLIAGLVAGIFASFIVYVGLTVGLPYWKLEPPPATPLMTIVLPTIVIYSIYGVFLGIIFSKIYDLIPGKTGVLKGLVFGLGYYLIVSIRNMLNMLSLFHTYLFIGFPCICLVWIGLIGFLPAVGVRL